MTLETATTLAAILEEAQEHFFGIKLDEGRRLLDEAKTLLLETAYQDANPGQSFDEWRKENDHYLFPRPDGK